MNRTYKVVEISGRDKATGSDPIVPHELASNMVRIFIGRDVSLAMVFAALDQAKVKLASGERMSVTPDMAGKTPH